MRLGLILCLTANNSAAWCTDLDWETIPSRDNGGTILIRVSWVAGDQPLSGTGTGIVVDNAGTVLTVSHIFPNPTPSDLLIVGETEGDGHAIEPHKLKFKLSTIDHDDSADFAILVPVEEFAKDGPVPLNRVPLDWDWTPVESRAVRMRGYPLGQALEGTSGTIKRGGLSPKVPTDALLRAGYSGGPVYEAAGNVVGIINGGDKVVNVTNDPTVMGLAHFMPLALLAEKVPTGVRAQTSVPLPASRPTVASTIRISFAIDETKETTFNSLQDLEKPASSQTYNKHVTAQEGYRIVKYEYVEHSATKVSDKKIAIAKDGSSVDVDFTLTSGPGFNRWRGWLAATIVTVQEPKGDSK